MYNTIVNNMPCSCWFHLEFQNHFTLNDYSNSIHERVAINTAPIKIR